MSSDSKIVIGWREWVALPDLQLPAIKAKVDTGARTSSLHAFDIETYTEKGELRVRFKVHPLSKSEIAVQCSAPVVDHRTVADSGGHREKRYVIITELSIGELKFPIEITLANRETMTHRMLFGRSAMKNFIIAPDHSYLLGRPAQVKALYANIRIKPKKKSTSKPPTKSSSAKSAPARSNKPKSESKS
jgi:hypothetical protein